MPVAHSAGQSLLHDARSAVLAVVRTAWHDLSAVPWLGANAVLPGRHVTAGVAAAMAKDWAQGACAELGSANSSSGGGGRGGGGSTHRVDCISAGLQGHAEAVAGPEGSAIEVIRVGIGSPIGGLQGSGTAAGGGVNASGTAQAETAQGSTALQENNPCHSRSSR